MINVMKLECLWKYTRAIQNIQPHSLFHIGWHKLMYDFVSFFSAYVYFGLLKNKS